MTSGTSSIRITDDRGVRVLTMDRPDVRNAMSTALLTDLVEAVAQAVADPRINVLAFTGSEGHFSAGADLSEELDHEGNVRRMDLFCALYEAAATCPKPTVAAIAGSCVGGGAELAAACDLRIADPTARFQFPGAAMAVPIGAAKLIGLVGLGTAKDLVLTCRRFDADEAARIGFVQRRADVGGAVREAIGVARELQSSDQDAVAFLKRQFSTFSGLGDRVAAENDTLHALAESGGDYAQLPAPGPRAVGGWSAGSWDAR